MRHLRRRSTGAGGPGRRSRSTWGQGYEVTGFTWRVDPEPDAAEGAGAPSGAERGAPSVLNRRYYYRLEKLDGTEKQ